MNRQNSRRHPDLLELALLAGGLLLAVAFLLPVLVVALPAVVALWCLPVRRRWWLVYGLLAALLLLRWHDWRGYLALQQQAGMFLLHAALTHQSVAGWPFLLAYARLSWPYALSWGPLLGTLGALVWPFLPFPFPKSSPGTGRSALILRDAKVLGREKEAAVYWGARGLAGSGVLTLVSAGPKIGKSWLLFALLRAMQDRHPFFGLPTQPMRVLYCTEEGQSFGRLVRQFGIEASTLVALRRQEVNGWEWPDLTKAIKDAAWRNKCGLVVIDTLGAWCPAAEKGVETAADAMEPLRSLTASGLGVVLLHHDRKTGGTDASGVRGSSALVAAVDIVVSVARVANQPRQRRLTVLGRYGEELPADVLTGRLDGVRYLPVCGDVVDEEAGLPAPEPALPQLVAPASRRDLPPPLRETLAYLRGAGAQSTSQIRAALGIGLGTANRRLTVLEEKSLISRTNRDRPGLAQTWTCTEEGLNA